jgi:hypothetical protein
MSTVQIIYDHRGAVLKARVCIVYRLCTLNWTSTVIKYGLAQIIPTKSINIPTVESKIFADSVPKITFRII